MSETRVVNKYKESYSVYIGRGSKWGNPFVIGKDGNRREVINLYREWIVNQPQFKDIEQLRGQTLGCFCHPQPCHGDVLVEFLELRSTSAETQ
jgi:hypothetical protein